MSHNCLSYSFCPWGCDWRFDGLEGQQTVHISGNMESNSSNALVLAAVRGHGLILMRDFLVPINAVFPLRHHRSANVRSFLKLVTKRISAVSNGSTLPAGSASDPYSLH
jgi:hypothetical protein